MTAHRFREVLRLLHWSGRGLADLLACDERLIRRWAAGTNLIPVPVAAWLETLASVHAKHPPPGDWKQRAA